MSSEDKRMSDSASAEYETIEVTRQGAVGLIRLNRPKQLNALNRTMSLEILSAAQAMVEDDTIRALVLTGSTKAFAAGADIAEMSRMSTREMQDTRWFVEWDQFATLPIPKIAAVNGYALGGGCELMMMCDFAIAGDSAQFGQPEVKLGIMAGIGGSQRLTRLVGRSLSMDMHLTGRMVGAQEALRAGLVARVVPDGDVVAQALDAANTIATYAPETLRNILEAISWSEEGPLSHGIARERAAFYDMFGTPAQTEGMAAFLEKRPAKF